ncbi:MAG: hypothetical protein GYB67_01765 [Chloroflexi bacterium]|nr:hypothetical protein [Chloroflexota bacterium]
MMAKFRKLMTGIALVALTLGAAGSALAQDDPSPAGETASTTATFACDYINQRVSQYSAEDQAAATRRWSISVDDDGTCQVEVTGYRLPTLTTLPTFTFDGADAQSSDTQMYTLGGPNGEIDITLTAVTLEALAAQYAVPLSADELATVPTDTQTYTLAGPNGDITISVAPMIIGATSGQMYTLPPALPPAAAPTLIPQTGSDALPAAPQSPGDTPTGNADLVVPPELNLPGN